MHPSTYRFIALIFILTLLSNTSSSDDIRQRFEGLVGKSVQEAWKKINREARGRPVEFMLESSPQAKKSITPGYVRVIIGDRTGRVLYTPILQPN